jgi:AraC-like DNA-binding protein
MHAALPSQPQLQPWVAQLWSLPRPVAPPSHAREHSLPAGAMHLAIRLDGPPLRLYADAADRRGATFEPGVVAGARDAWCIKDTARPAASVGAMLRPGAALALFGVSAAELAGRHVSLADLCGGTAADALYTRLAETAEPARRRWLLERFLTTRLRGLRGLDPQIAAAVQRLEHDPATPIAALADASGRSHRHFIARFREQVGLPPRRYARVRRFARLLSTLGRHPDWADAALAAGYFDQSHLIREFRALGGVTPRQYLAAHPHAPLHLPVAHP